MTVCRFAVVVAVTTASLVGSAGCGGNRPSMGPYTTVGVGSSSGGMDSGSDAGAAVGNGDDAGACGAGDPNMPPEPTIPPACTTLTATQAVAVGTLPSEAAPDTMQIQAALNACPTGHSVQLTTGGGNNAFLTGPLSLPSGVTLWVDTGTTLYASRNPAVYGATCGTATGACLAVIQSIATSNTGVVGDGVIDGQGAELMVGLPQSWWDLTNTSNGASGNPPLIQVQKAANFTLYRITLQNSPKFHVKLGAMGFVAWGVTIKTPSSPTNSQGVALTAAKAPNTDGIDPGEQASNGFIVCSKISVGDDQIAIKGGTSVSHLVIAHNHFGAGHGMSIGSETNGGVSDVNVYDLSIDGTGTGMKNGASNGIRIKSDMSEGGPVSNITYSDVCVRNVSNPIILNPTYSAATGTLIPLFTGITIQNFHYLAGANTPTVTLRGFDAAHLTDITLDNVVVDGLGTANVVAAEANVTLGPGGVSFTPSGTDVTVTDETTGPPTPNPCTGKWITF
jgi:polygalacturonase